MPPTSGSDALNIVLVHGAWADGSGWEAVYRFLRKKGFPVSVSNIRRSRLPMTSERRDGYWPRRRVP